jgi:hypothetical protein
MIKTYSKAIISALIALLILSIPIAVFAGAQDNEELEINKDIVINAPKEAYDVKALENRLSKYYFKPATPYVTVYKIKITPETRYTLKIVYPGDKSLSQIEIIGENPYSKSTALLSYNDALSSVKGYSGSVNALIAPYTYKSNFTVDAKSTGRYLYILAEFEKPGGSLKMRLSTPAEDDKTVVYTDSHASGISNSLTLNAVKMPDDFQQLKLKINSRDAFSSGVLERLKVAPIIESSTTLVPLRYIGEALGAKVNWSAEDKSATFTLGSTSVVVWIGKTTALVNVKEEVMALPPSLVDGNTLIPLRFIAEKLGASVQWFDKTKEIVISY